MLNLSDLNDVLSLVILKNYMVMLSVKEKRNKTYSGIYDAFCFTWVVSCKSVVFPQNIFYVPYWECHIKSLDKNMYVTIGDF